MAETRYFYGLGRRKSAIAKVRLYEDSSNEFVVNGKDSSAYFADDFKEITLTESLKAVGKEKAFRVSVVTRGGGLSSQADAIRLGIAKALVEFDPSMRKTLKEKGYLSRDPRAKERKKPGLRKARRAPQFSKR